MEYLDMAARLVVFVIILVMAYRTDFSILRFIYLKIKHR